MINNKHDHDHQEHSPVIDTIKEILPAVVSITISKKYEEIKNELSEDVFAFPYFKNSKIKDEEMIKIGGGSGFIIDPKGIVLTNKHVISEPKATYTVITNDGESYEAEVLSRDPVDDVAILKIDANKKMPFIKIGSSHDLELGQTVIAVGNALGLFKNTVSVGIVSGLSRSIAAKVSVHSPIQELRGLIQTDAAINPGNSGGPLVNIFGEAIGINTAIVYGAQNIGFALPIDSAKRDLDDLEKYGRILRPLLGIRYVTIDENIKKRLNLEVDYGAIIVKGEHKTDEAIVKNSPAHKAKLKEKDIILEINGLKITQDKTIQDFLEELSVGDEAKLKILRGKKKFDVKITLTERK